MREIITVAVGAAGLPPTTSDEASRVYRTLFATGPQVDPAEHLNAKLRLQTFVADAIANPTVQGLTPTQALNLEQQMEILRTGRKITAWADRVFRSLLASKEDFVVVEARTPQPSLQDVYDLQEKVQAAAKQNRVSVARNFIREVETLLDMQPADAATRTASLAATVAAFAAEGLAVYRSELEAPLLAHFDALAVAAEAKAKATPLPTLAEMTDAIAAFQRYRVMSATVLHESSRGAFLCAVGNCVFAHRTCYMHAITCLIDDVPDLDLDAVAALASPGRQADWRDRVAHRIRRYLFPGGVLDDGALQRMLELRRDKRVPLDCLTRAVRDNLPGLQLTAPLDTLLAALVDRIVRGNACTKYVAPLRELIKDCAARCDTDGLVRRIEADALARANATGASTPDQEHAVVLALDQSVGRGRTVHLRQLHKDVVESATVTDNYACVFGGAGCPLVTLRCFHSSMEHAVSRLELPMPPSLAAIGDGLQLIYRDQFSRRKLAFVLGLSRVTVLWSHAGGATTLVMPATHMHIVDIVTVHTVPLTRTRVVELAAAVGVAPEMATRWLDDLVRGGVVADVSGAYTIAASHTATRQNIEPAGAAAKRAAGNAMTPLQRRCVLESALVQHLKHAASMPRAGAYAYCAMHVRQLGGIRPKEVDAALANLAAKGYVDCADPAVVQYVA